METHINQINANQNGKEITFTGEITKVKEKKFKPIFTVFECKTCLRTHELKQEGYKIYEPTHCDECGGRKFEILPTESKYNEFQEITVKDNQNYVDRYNREREPASITCILQQDDVNQHMKNDKVKITGTLKLKSLENLYVEVSKIELTQ